MKLLAINQMETIEGGLNCFWTGFWTVAVSGVAVGSVLATGGGALALAPGLVAYAAGMHQTLDECGLIPKSK
jgi:hypothetical protein